METFRFRPSDLIVKFFDRDLVVHGRRCLRSRHRESTCTRCAIICPHGSIALGAVPAVAAEKCTGCGVCIGVCPTGVFELPGFSYADLLGRLSGRDNPVMACAKGNTDTDLIVPCLGALNADFLMAAALLSGAGIALDSSPCKGCANAEGLQVAEATAGFAAAAIEQAGVSRSLAVAPVARPEEVSRRDVFARARRQTATTLARAISDDNKAEEPITGLPSLASPTRNLAVALLRSKAVQASPGRGLIPFFTLSVSPGCDGCGICAKYCATGSLSVARENGKLVVRHDTSECIGCGLCHDACRLRLISVRPLASMEPVLRAEKMVLLEAGLLSCAQCGQGYVPVGSARLCPDCRRAGAVRQALWDDLRNHG